jgi:kumamolisin
LTSTNSYGQEQAWDENESLASGGGVSMRFTIAPSWQAGPRFKTGVGRAVPDVAADAAAISELAFYLYDPSCGQDHWLGAEAKGMSDTCGLLGGTSMSAPIWAGIAAIYDQYAALNGAAPLGFANPKLYKLERGTAAFRPFHEVNSVENGGGDLYRNPGYSPTGLGTPDVYNIMRDLVPSSTPTTTGP